MPLNEWSLCGLKSSESSALPPTDMLSLWWAIQIQIGNPIGIQIEIPIGIPIEIQMEIQIEIRTTQVEIEISTQSVNHAHTFARHASEQTKSWPNLSNRSQFMALFWPYRRGSLLFILCCFYFSPFPLSYLPKAEFVFYNITTGQTPDYCCPVLRHRFNRIDTCEI